VGQHVGKQIDVMGINANISKMKIGVNNFDGGLQK